MNEWLPVVVGFGMIAAIGGVAAAAVRFWPHGWIATELLRPAGLVITGPYEVPSRRDRLRRASLIIASSPLLFATSYVAFALSQRLPGRSSGQLTAEAYFFVCSILSIVMLLAGLGELWKAARTRPRLVEGEAEVVAEDLISYLEDVVADERGDQPWFDFAAVRYDDNRIERLRIALVVRFPLKRPPRSHADREALAQLLQGWRSGTA